MLLLAFWVACADAGCDGAAESVAATRPMARVRAIAAALSVALLFILFTPNRNHGGRAAAVHAHDRPLRNPHIAGHPCAGRRRIIGRPARCGAAATHPNPPAPALPAPPCP